MTLRAVVLAVAATLAGPASGAVTTPDGASIHYLEAGRGPAMLFVPGWTMPAEIFAPQLAHFGSAWRAVAMDPRAHGRSSKTPEGHDMATRGRDIAAVIEGLRLAPVVLIGWSNGATEVAAYIDQFGTGALAGIVFVDGTVGGTATPEVRDARLKLMPRMFTDRRAFTESFVRGMYRTPQPDAYIASIVEGALQMPTAMAVTTGLTASLVDYRPVLSRVDVPAMIVVARSPFLDWYEDMRARMPHARYEVMDGVGHALFVDDAPRFNALLEEFSRTTRGARPPRR